MDQSSFEDHLDRHGGDLGTWPAVLRPGAESLLASSLAARRAHDAMLAVERVLATRPAASGGGVDAMAAVAMRHRQARPGLRLATRAGWSGAAAAVLALGLIVGAVAPRPHDESPERVVAAALEPAGSSDVD